MSLRYALAAREITSRRSDLVFLQECEAAFFDAAWNSAAPTLLQEYELFPCRVSHTAGGEEPGTAILVRQLGRAVAIAKAPVCIGGTKETGGQSKVATVLPVRVGDLRDVIAVSTHFTWDGASEARLYHAQLLGNELRTRHNPIILVVYFSCQPVPTPKAFE